MCFTLGMLLQIEGDPICSTSTILKHIWGAKKYKGKFDRAGQDLGEYAYFLAFFENKNGVVLCISKHANENMMLSRIV